MPPSTTSHPLQTVADTHLGSSQQHSYDGSSVTQDERPRRRAAAAITEERLPQDGREADSAKAGEPEARRRRFESSTSKGTVPPEEVEEGAATTDDKVSEKAQVSSVSLPPVLAWIVPVVTSWAKLKPVLRSAIVAWICLLLMVINPVERRLGNASFLLLVGVFIQPCELPVVAVIEREMFTLGLLLVAWAWSCLGTIIAVQARTYRLAPTEAPLSSIFSGEYIQGGEAVICGFFLSIGAAALLYLKVRFGPS